MEKRSKRLLIFIVTFNAETTMQKVINGIPSALNDYDYEILIIDDSSDEKTFRLVLEYKQKNPDKKLEVFFNPKNQGHGGNQKIGFLYAVEQGFDAVVLLHGDGQYQQELFEDLALPVLKGEADAVLGSRMIRPSDALKGGMPLYKFIGNRILNTIQNFSLGSCLSEFHSGYRAYSVKALSEIPFHCNTNDFHFDTEIIIQFLLKGFRIKEIPIPTYYGDEIYYVNGLKYAWNVIKTVVNSRLCKLGVFYQRKYDVIDFWEVYDLKLGYVSSHTMTLEEVRGGSNVLEIGCGKGLLAEVLKEKGCSVHGLDQYDIKESTQMDLYTKIDLNIEKIDFSLDQYDYILLLDIIEHLNYPENLLDNIRVKSRFKKPTVIITVPNVAFFLVRLRLLFGNFQYGKIGILDLTHSRLFTFKSIENMLMQCGYEILSCKGIPGPYPKALGDNFFSRALLMMNSIFIKICRGLFSYQIFVKAVPLPTVSDLLYHTRHASAHMMQRRQ